MKRIILFFTVCLGLSVSQTTLADSVETARAASKREAPTNVATTPQQSGRTVSSVARKNEQNLNTNKITRSATKTPQQNVVPRTSTTKQTVKSRNTTKAEQNTSHRSAVTASRTGTPNRTRSEKREKTSVRSASKTPIRISRAGDLNTAQISEIKSKDYSKCKTVYYECMDEFCANKDTDLRRCACSSRVHEFDGIKKQLANAEDKMLAFNQRLLTVALDKEDAAAINVATEGETAYNTKDRSESEKMLKKITNALNGSGNSRLNNNLSSISLSLDMDSAWDNIDSLSGISTTAKSGLDLYKAAGPVCIEMAKEICSDDELDIVQNSYKLTIEQDCNTVAKSYNNLYNQTMEKIHESGALLDMSRLNRYQQKNSDDTLTCKKKILDQLYDPAVCGQNLYKCLDITGQYIDPSTGEAFLSGELYNLINLLQTPADDDKWSKTEANKSFVKFLDSKKEFLKPAIEQCADIADNIWQDFLEDALANIKRAQYAKLEEIRQSCTTLVSECKTNILEDLSDFDSRALSTFQVVAYSTADAACADIQNSCIAVMEQMGGGEIWGQGMAGIATQTAYKSIIDTCSTIGRDCIIRQCNGTAGNFALCRDMNSDPRCSVLTRAACWDEVLSCVNASTSLRYITTDISAETNAHNEYYQSLYELEDASSVPNLCGNLSGTNQIACLITEQIWGNCENDSESGVDNAILMPNNDETLLSWFAKNTGAADNKNSCLTTQCKINNNTSDGCYVNALDSIIYIGSALTNVCPNGVTDDYGNCCLSGYVNNGICVSSENENAIVKDINQDCDSMCDTTDLECNYYYCPEEYYESEYSVSVYCLTTESTIENDVCNKWVVVDQYGNYFDKYGNDSGIKMLYRPESATCPVPEIGTEDISGYCKYNFDATNKTWNFAIDENTPCTTEIPAEAKYLIYYVPENTDSGD